MRRLERLAPSWKETDGDVIELPVLAAALDVEISDIRGWLVGTTKAKPCRFVRKSLHLAVPIDDLRATWIALNSHRDDTKWLDDIIEHLRKVAREREKFWRNSRGGGPLKDAVRGGTRVISASGLMPRAPIIIDGKVRHSKSTPAAKAA
jgi:hypothetical protein